LDVGETVRLEAEAAVVASPGMVIGA